MHPENGLTVLQTLNTQVLALLSGRDISAYDTRYYYFYYK